MVGDMIVNLYQKDLWRDTRKYNIKRIFPSDKERLMSFIKKNFPDEKGWLIEAEHAWHNGNVYVAVECEKIIGFACYDSSGKGYFGPFGVNKDYRSKGVGTELFYACLDAMKNDGYGYAIIGWVADKEDDEHSPVEFYEKTSQAKYIPSSNPKNTIYSNKVNISQYDFYKALVIGCTRTGKSKAFIRPEKEINVVTYNLTLTDEDISWLWDYIEKHGVSKFYIDPWYIALLKGYLSLIDGTEYNTQIISDANYISDILNKNKDSEQLKWIKGKTFAVLFIQTAIQNTCEALGVYRQYKSK